MSLSSDGLLAFAPRYLSSNESQEAAADVAAASAFVSASSAAACAAVTAPTSIIIAQLATPADSEPLAVWAVVQMNSEFRDTDPAASLTMSFCR